MYRSFDGRRISVEYQFWSVCYSESSETCKVIFCIYFIAVLTLRLREVYCRDVHQHLESGVVLNAVMDDTYTVGLFSNKIYNDNYYQIVSNTITRSIIRDQSLDNCSLLLALRPRTYNHHVRHRRRHSSQLEEEYAKPNEYYGIRPGLEPIL